MAQFLFLKEYISANMKNTALLLKALDIELKKLLSEDIKRFRNQQQANETVNREMVKKAA